MSQKSVQRWKNCNCKTNFCTQTRAGPAAGAAQAMASVAALCHSCLGFALGGEAVWEDGVALAPR